MPQRAPQTKVAQCSQIIYDGFIRYDVGFRKITRRARRRFVAQDWKGHQQDIVERIELYEKSVCSVVKILTRLLSTAYNDYAFWHEVKIYFAERLDQVPDVGFIKTFFNSVSRRIFGTIGVDERIEFIAAGLIDDDASTQTVNLRRYPYWGSLERIFETILDDFSFSIGYRNSVRDAQYIAEQINQFMAERGDLLGYIRFEFIATSFYQLARAYLVGRIILRAKVLPLVIALKNEKQVVAVDAVLMSDAAVSTVFGYTRSYYFAELNSVLGAVHFLHSIIPQKPIDELYTVLGRLRQGKTERYRAFTEHLYKSADQFEHAQGDAGLVMIVFTLPSYDLVFKIMRDRFGYPKKISRQHVIDQYKLVSRQDRAGRLIDTQEFLNITFPVELFSDALLQDLLLNASNTVTKDGDNLRIKQAYVERRLRPLNLYLNEVDFTMASQAVIDYGYAIKDLAHSNIFPGDLLLKNFGLTRHGRVVFYDFDEVLLVSNCNFRDIPETNDINSDMQAESWFYIAPNDIFPEEFIKFLALKAQLREVFLSVHEDLMTAAYWQDIQRRLAVGEVMVTIPYVRPALSSTST